MVEAINHNEVVERVNHIQNSGVNQLKPISGRWFFALLKEAYSEDSVVQAVDRLYTAFEKQRPEFIERINAAVSSDQAQISPEDQKYIVDYIFNSSVFLPY